MISKKSHDPREIGQNVGDDVTLLDGCGDFILKKNLEWGAPSLGRASRWGLGSS